MWARSIQLRQLSVLLSVLMFSRISFLLVVQKANEMTRVCNFFFFFFTKMIIAVTGLVGDRGGCVGQGATFCAEVFELLFK